MTLLPCSPGRARNHRPHPTPLPRCQKPVPLLLNNRPRTRTTTPRRGRGDVPSASLPAAHAEALPAELNDAQRAAFVRLATEILGHIESKTPEEYAEYLKNQAKGGDVDAQHVLGLLGGGESCEGIVAKVRTFKRYQDLRPYVEKLEQKRDYISVLIRAIDAVDHNSGTGSSHEPPPCAP